MGFVLGIFIIYIIGYVIRRAVFFRSGENTSVFEKIGLDSGFGAGVTALVLFYLSGLGVPLSERNLYVIGVSAFIVFVCVKAFDFVMHERRGKGAPASGARKFDKKTGIFFAIIAICLAVSLFRSVYLPAYEWASRSIFGIKARVIYESKTVYDKDLFDGEFTIEHPEYPLFMPLLETWVNSYTGREDERTGKGFLFLLAAGFISLLYGAQRKFCGRMHAAVFTAVYATLPVFVYRMSGGEADGPLAFFYTAAFAYMALWTALKKNVYLLTAALFTAFAMFTKNEAAAFFMIMAATIAAVLITDGTLPVRRKAASMAVYAAPVVILVLPWLVYSRMIPKNDVIFTFRDVLNPHVFAVICDNAGRIWPIVRNFIFDLMLKPTKWNMFWFVFFAAQIFSFREMFKRPYVFLTFFMWANVFVYFFMFLTIPLRIEHMFVTMDRLFLQMSGVMILFTSIIAARSNLLTDEEWNPDRFPTLV